MGCTWQIETRNAAGSPGRSFGNLNVGQVVGIGLMNKKKCVMLTLDGNVTTENLTCDLQFDKPVFGAVGLNARCKKATLLQPNEFRLKELRIVGFS